MPTSLYRAVGEYPPNPYSRKLHEAVCAARRFLRGEQHQKASYVWEALGTYPCLCRGLGRDFEQISV